MFHKTGKQLRKSITKCLILVLTQVYVYNRKLLAQLRLRCDGQQERGRTGGAAWQPVVAHDDPPDQERQ